MLTVAQFLEWLMVFRYTGTVHYGGTTWMIDSNDVNGLIRKCHETPQLMQELLAQGHCTEGREALAYLKYLEQAGRTYVMVL